MDFDEDVSIFMEVPDTILEGNQYSDIGENIILRKKLQDIEMENQKLKIELFKEKKRFEKEKDLVISNAKSELDRMKAEWLFRTHHVNTRYPIQKNDSYSLYVNKESMKHQMSELYILLQKNESVVDSTKSLNTMVQLLVDVMSWQSRPCCESYFDIVGKWIQELYQNDNTIWIVWFIKWMWLLEELCQTFIKRYYISTISNTNIHDKIFCILLNIYKRQNIDNQWLEKLLIWRLSLLPKTKWIQYQIHLEKLKESSSLLSNLVSWILCKE